MGQRAEPAHTWQDKEGAKWERSEEGRGRRNIVIFESMGSPLVFKRNPKDVWTDVSGLSFSSGQEVLHLLGSTAVLHSPWLSDFWVSDLQHLDQELGDLGSRFTLPPDHTFSHWVWFPLLEPLPPGLRREGVVLGDQGLFSLWVSKNLWVCISRHLC